MTKSGAKKMSEMNNMYDKTTTVTNSHRYETMQRPVGRGIMKRQWRLVREMNEMKWAEMKWNEVKWRNVVMSQMKKNEVKITRMIWKVWRWVKWNECVRWVKQNECEKKKW